MKPNGILEVYYGEEINGEFKQFARPKYVNSIF